MPYKPALAVVIPVYNEANNLPGLLRDWQPVFRSLEVPYTLIVIDDGSKDNSLQQLQTMATNDPTLDIHTQPNAGHGPAIMRGYRLGLDADWVFQIDSDHQFEPQSFQTLWNMRDEYDLLLAQRREKNAAPGRQWISRVSTATVQFLYGKGVEDVNTPYRLIRSACLKEAIARMPAGPFAPNVLITAWCILKKKRIFTTEAYPRSEGARPGRMSRYFLFGALQSFFQTLLFRIRL